APLWGTRLAADAIGGTAFYLHDGRTTELEEAISLHGGEAENARNLFNSLSDSDRKAIIAFLRSL
ncbi:MAG TPA: thiol oxidoreductase, partial [bacterium]|nr:thiol oxidoreductase [bacterium]